MGSDRDHGPGGDFNADGSWDFFDVSGFLNAFTSGCP